MAEEPPRKREYPTKGDRDRLGRGMRKARTSPRRAPIPTPLVTHPLTPFPPFESAALGLRADAASFSFSPSAPSWEPPSAAAAAPAPLPAPAPPVSEAAPPAAAAPAAAAAAAAANLVTAPVAAAAAEAAAPAAAEAPPVAPAAAAPAALPPPPPPPAAVAPPAVPPPAAAASAAGAGDEDAAAEYGEAGGDEDVDLDLDVDAADIGGGGGGAGGAGAAGGGSGGGGGAAKKKGADEPDAREHLNVIHIGHVDSGKSTLSGSILYHTGQIDQRTIEKFEREAKQRGRESWWLAFILDTTEEERNKGITVEVGRACFETEHKRFTILDAPGHKSFVANMIQGAAQADIATLVISARKGEFETGFEKGGQTREHALLAKTLGVRYLLVVINKMDDITVNWSKERYDEIVGKLTPFLRGSGYNVAKHVNFLPIAAISGTNVKERVTKAACPWYDGPSLLELLDGLSIGGRDPDGPLRVPVLDKYMDRGIICMGKVECGTLRENQDLVIMPQGTKAKVDKVYINDLEVSMARPGENVKIKIKGCGEDEVVRGFVVCTREEPVLAVTQFECQLMVLELDHKALFTAGYSAVLHIHTAEEEVTVVKLCSEIDKKTGEAKPGPPPRFVKSGALCVCVLKTSRSICVEKFEQLQQLGRFTLRDEGRTIGIGKVLRLGVPRGTAPRPAAAAAAGAGAGAGGP
jgi:peptide chain release factor subunit 3